MATTRTRRTRRRRLPADQARQSLLEAGRDLVYENPLGEPLDHIRVSDVVARLGLSVGSIYHYWETQDDYRDDLLDLLLSPDRFPAVHLAGEEVAELIEHDPSFEDLARDVAAISFQGLAEGPDRQRLTLALVAYDDPEINARLGDQIREISHRWADLFAAYFPRFGLEPRPPFTYDSLAIALTGLVEGMHLRLTVDPDAVTGEVEEGWDLFGSAALALILGATRPVEPAEDPADEDRSLWALARRLIPRRSPRAV
jgi:AcrR family transcriptional regulator